MDEAQPPWTARTGTGPAPDLVAYGECTDTDEALVEVDLAGSIAHVVGLHEAELVTHEEAISLVEGLQALAEQAAEDGIELDPTLEDVHMNVEHLLEQQIGQAADKLHTARSRNDEVALDLRLATRQGLVQLAEATHELAASLAEQAQANLQTPWPLHTHGLPAQPATLGYLFHAHALRLTRDVDDVLSVFASLDESPLGAGAGAGSTLPTDPSVPAELLGLEPPSNGLLATGTRDGSLEATQAAAQIGHHVQDLAADLLSLASQGAIELPPAYTTGSSIMPHKRNPDALELARADGAHLGQLADQIASVTAGLGLGYDRDLQRAKPPLLEALALGPQVAGILTAIVDGLAVDEDVLADLGDDPEIATTDAVEALVDHGVAFRQAHQVVSQACQVAEQGTPLAEALQAVDLPEGTIDAGLAALAGDVENRSTTGGPAPARVADELASLADELAQLEEAIADAAEAADQPLQLLETPPEDLLAYPPKVTP